MRQPFQRLIDQVAWLAQLIQCMDTFEDKQCLEELHQSQAPWKVWNHTTTVESNGSETTLASAHDPSETG